MLSCIRNSDLAIYCLGTNLVFLVLSCAHAFLLDVVITSSLLIPRIVEMKICLIVGWMYKHVALGQDDLYKAG